MGFAEINASGPRDGGAGPLRTGRGVCLAGNSIDALLAVSDAVQVLAGSTEGPPPEVPKLTEWLKQRTQAEVARATKGEAAAPEAEAAPPPATPASVEVTPGARQGGHRQREGRRRGGPGHVGGGHRLGGERRQARRATGLGSHRAGAPGGDHLGGDRPGSAVPPSGAGLGAPAAARPRADADSTGRSRTWDPPGLPVATKLARSKELAAELHREAKLLASEELRDLTQLSDEIQSIRMLPCRCS